MPTITSNSMRTTAAAALLAAGVASLASGASAMPIADALALKNAAPANVETVQWRGGWRGGGWRGGGWRGGGWGGPGAGFVAGAIIGGALAGPGYYGGSPYYYGPGPYYGAPPVDYGYDDQGPAPGPVGGDAVAYCMQRFKSYDPRSGTYMGYDGNRHPCP